MSAAAFRLTPLDITRVVIATDEQAAITAWASRHHWDVALDLDALRLTASTLHPATGQTVTFNGDFEGYPAQAPAWWCGTVPSDKASYPAPMATAVPGLQGSVFHPNPCICAPWNRLAYAAHQGPHSDWGTTTDWKQAAPTYTQAHTIPDMLAALRLHLQHSPGMQV